MLHFFAQSKTIENSHVNHRDRLIFEEEENAEKKGLKVDYLEK
jgi:hypothetical protein